MAQININKPQSQGPDLGNGAVVFLGIGLVLVAAIAFGSFVVTLIVSSLSLIGTLAAAARQGLFSEGLSDLVIDLVWGAGVGLFLGWGRWKRRKHSGAVETVVEAVASPDVVSSVSLGWMYVSLHIGAGLLAGLVVWLLGLAFPSQILAGPDVTHAGLEYLRAAGWMAGGGGGSGGDRSSAALLFFVLLFLLLVVLPLFAALIHALFAISIKGAAAGAMGAAGKRAGLILFLVLTTMRRKLWLPKPPVPEPQPISTLDPSPLDMDKIIEDFIATGSADRRSAVDGYLSWLKKQGIEPNTRTIGKNAPRFKHSVIYELARRVNFEIARRNPERVDYHLESWKKATEEARSHYETRLREELFGSGWLKRAVSEGLGTGALTGILTSLLIAIALWLLNLQ